MIQTISLALEGGICRAHYLIGIYTLNDKIVFLHSILGDTPKELITKNTVFPQYIVADFFSADFTVHTQAHIVYSEQRKTLFESCCECEPGEDCLLLNTVRYRPHGGIYPEYDPFGTVAKMIEIRDGSICEIGESPEPVEKIYCDGKTFTFGDYSVRMASPFTMECASRTTGKTLWKLRLSAYLYTDIEEKNGVLYFGTAGKGGRFCGVTLHDGSELFSYDTGGTDHYAWFGDHALVVDRKGDIVLLDAKTGVEKKRLDLRKKKLCAFAQMVIKNGTLYAVARHNKNYYDFYAVRVDLKEYIDQ